MPSGIIVSGHRETEEVNVQCFLQVPFTWDPDYEPVPFEPYEAEERLQKQRFLFTRVRRSGTVTKS